MSETFVMFGHNILQAFIRENRQNKENPFGIWPRTRFNQLRAAMEKYHPDIIAFQECDEGWHALIDSETEGLPTLGYASATDGWSDEPLHMMRNVLYYDTAKFTVVEAGYQAYTGYTHGFIANPWHFNWAVLESKESGKRFAVSSTHLIWTSIDFWPERDRFARELCPKLHELEEKYGIGVVAMGDYNAHLKEAAYKTLSENFASARDAAPITENMQYRTDKDLGELPVVAEESTRGIVDHCFFTKEKIEPLKYEIMLDADVLSYTDHCPQRFTFRLK